MYTDSANQPIAPGDYVVYAKSGYARIAKILDIRMTGKTNWRQATEHQMIVMTASDNKTFKREFKFYPWDLKFPMKSYSVLRIDRPPQVEEKLIEDRIARM